MVLTRNESEYDRNKELAEFDDTKAGVKGLLEQGIERIPQIFVNQQFIQEKKSNSSKFGIPVIDLGCLNKDRAGIIGQVKDACQEGGFSRLKIMGLDKVVDGVRMFHEQDAEVKKQYYSRDFAKKVVYNSNFDLLQAKRANWRDTLYLIMAPNPQELPQACREAMMEYSNEVKKVGLLVLELMSEALGLNANHLKDMDCGEPI